MTQMKIDLGVDYHVYPEDQEIDLDNLTYKQWSKSVRNFCAHHIETEVTFKSSVLTPR